MLDKSPLIVAIDYAKVSLKPSEVASGERGPTPRKSLRAERCCELSAIFSNDCAPVADQFRSMATGSEGLSRTAEHMLCPSLFW